MPSENSPAKNELKDFSKPELLKTAYAQGNILIEVSGDQLIAITRSITEPLLTIAPFVSARAILESSAIASWILDTSIDRKKRLERSFAFRYEGLNQQIKYGRSIGNKNEIDKVLSRVDEVEKQALDLGYDPVLDKNGKRIGIAMKMPSITTLVHDVLKEEGSYRFLSSIAHAHPWALQQISFQEVTKGKDLFFEKNIDPVYIFYLCNTVVRVFARSIWNMNNIFGWQEEKLINLFNYVFDSLNMKNQFDRFWIT